ncbi:MAG: DUF7793 family protein [Bacteroidia bacterium]
MKPPKSAEVFETPTSTYWFEDGILYAVTRKSEPLPFETQKQQTEAFIKKLNGKKICAVIDVTNASQTSKETREYNLKALPEIFKAMAFITHNAVGKMLAHLYFGFNPLPLPAKVFSNEEEAIEWIKKQV